MRAASSTAISKPENLFLLRPSDDAPASTGPRVKVLDFGLARIVQGQALTSYGLALGTPSFMSPEQAAGRIDEIDGRTDLFALAATGFRICAGRRIHEAANPVDLVRKMATLAAPRIRSVRSDVSEACARVLDRALEFRREDRYETAAAMREDVERAIAEIQVRGPTRARDRRLRVRRSRPAFESVSSSAQATVELSARDLQPSRPPVEESIHLPRRRSFLPWLVLLVAGGGARSLGASPRWARAPERSRRSPPRRRPSPVTAGPDREPPRTRRSPSSCAIATQAGRRAGRLAGSASASARADRAPRAAPRRSSRRPARRITPRRARRGRATCTSCRESTTRPSLVRARADGGSLSECSS